MTHKLFEKAEEDFLMIILPRIIKECDTIEVAKEKALASCKRLCLPTDGLDQRFGKTFGGLIRKLPPDLRRAGRDVINQAKTRFPIGRIFGGRVFPPFF